MLRSHLSKFAFPLFMAADGGPGNTNPGNNNPAPKGTLEDQLRAAQSEIARLAPLESSLQTVTKERDDLRSQFSALETTANQTKTELATAQGTIGTLTKERDTARNEATTAQGNVSRLESLCQLRGVSTTAAVPPQSEQAPIVGHVYDQWQAATGAAKSALWREHHDAIRAEGNRRATATK